MLFRSVNYYNNGEELELFHAELNKTSSGGRLKSREYYFREAITWSFVSSSKFGVRYSNYGSIFDVAGSSLFPSSEDIYYITGFLCSNVVFEMLRMINPTLNYQAQDIKALPISIDKVKKKDVDDLVKTNIIISKTDWDCFETSWDFVKHPLVWNMNSKEHYNVESTKLIRDAFLAWEIDCDTRFKQLKRNEEELNRIFIDIYGLTEELTPNVEGKDVSVNLSELGRDVSSFLSYVVGCMFGRYSLDYYGLAYAGGEWKDRKSVV